MTISSMIESQGSSPRNSMTSLIKKMFSKKIKDNHANIDGRNAVLLHTDHLIEYIMNGKLDEPSQFLNWYFLAIKTVDLYKICYEAIQKVSNPDKCMILNFCYQITVHRKMSKYELHKSEVKQTIFNIYNYLKTSSSLLGPHAEKLRSKSSILYLSYKKLIKQTDYLTTNHPTAFLEELTQDPLANTWFHSLRPLLAKMTSWDEQQLHNYFAMTNCLDQSLIVHQQINSEPSIIQLIGDDLMWLQKYIFEHLTPIEFSKNYPKKTASDKCIVNYKSQAANFCSRLTMFVIEQIINKTNFKERVNMMLIFFALREYLYDHRDFQTAYAIHNAFYSAPIIRLTETWGHFKSTHDFEFRKAKLYEKIFSDKNNFKDTKKLFTALEKAQQPFIPLLNFYCGRIASLQETREQMDDDKFVASFKEIINKIFTPVKKFTVKKLQTDIFYMLRHVDISCQREDQLYQLSFKLEPPRNALEKELMQQV